MSRQLPAIVLVREVGPRDGLQGEAPLPPADRAGLVERLEAAGVREIEVAAFVSPRAVPSMAGAAEVIAALGPPPAGCRRWVLVPNRRGAELATEAGVDSVTVTVSASEGYSAKNVHMSVTESLAEAAAVTQLVGEADVVVSCAFGSPFEGDLDPSVVADVGEAALGAGAARITYADTTGMATPRRIEELLNRTGTDVGLHLHETRGNALVNAYAALEAGVTRFDTSVGGLGGSPFAPGAAGNLATEDLVYLCDDLGISTGISLDLLLAASAAVARLVGHAVPSRLAGAGPRTSRSATVPTGQVGQAGSASPP